MAGRRGTKAGAAASAMNQMAMMAMLRKGRSIRLWMTVAEVPTMQNQTTGETLMNQLRGWIAPSSCLRGITASRNQSWPISTKIRPRIRTRPITPCSQRYWTASLWTLARPAERRYSYFSGPM